VLTAAAPRHGPEKISFPDHFFCVEATPMERHDYLIVGLGNPDEQYLSTRHNLGFLIVDHLIRHWAATLPQEKWQSRYCSTRIGENRVHLLQPLTYMNRSGKAVAECRHFFKVTPDYLLVIHDDLDMRPGRIKLVKGGGTGGHNGLRSIVESLGTPDFYRLKFGIGRPGQGGVHRDFPVDRYVLSAMDDDERTTLERRLSPLTEGVELFLKGDPARAMSLLNALKD
jgi:peptidyl-tRNA hydrolase, PTH1 family